MSSLKNSHCWWVTQDGQRSIQISWRHTTSGETWSSVQQSAHIQSHRSLLGTPVSINSRTTAHTKALFTERSAWNCEDVLNRRQPSSQYRNVLPLAMRTNVKNRTAYKAVHILIIIYKPNSRGYFRVVQNYTGWSTIPAQFIPHITVILGEITCFRNWLCICCIGV